MKPTSPLIKELIDVPDSVQRGAFVLKLNDGIRHPKVTLDSYVVTPQLTESFESALNFVASALSGGSKAAYLHGSFGAGKSHFMAVLHRILSADPAALGIAELAPLLDKHQSWITRKKFLLVPYHMIGARSLESKILGEYAKFVREKHPDAPHPAVYQSEKILKNADQLRDMMGAEAFFARLNEGAARPGWGQLAAAWTPSTYAAACGPAGRVEERRRLVSDLVGVFFGSLASVFGADGEGFVDIDEGLAVICQHAQSLGYDALVLFLDELILWLASRVADLSFVQQECQKVVKLVEGGLGHRPIPLISFVARQRDLRELVGEHMPGAEKMSFADQLRHWEGRFHKITLEDRNLAAIVERRVLKPRSEAARLQLDEAFQKALPPRSDSVNTLLTPNGTKEAFRRVYPFSPALMETLVAVSSVLQRERTALRVLAQILTDQRETLRAGEIVPVGDLWDVLVEGDEPFHESMERMFRNARQLWFSKLVPLLEREHQLAYEDVRRRRVNTPAARAFRADTCYLHTLLIAALVPEVPSLRLLTASRLTALNHGALTALIPGREASDVTARLRRLGAAAGEIKVGDGIDPFVSVQISGIDVDTILDRVQTADNPGERKLTVRRLLWAMFGESGKSDSESVRTIFWRGTRREVDVVFLNVREATEESLRARGDTWRIVFDLPFDEPGFSPEDDLARIDQLKTRDMRARTVCWIPTFFSERSLSELGRLVKIEYALAGDRLARDLAASWSAADRQAAQGLLENQRSQLQNSLKVTLEAAYGIRSSANAGSLQNAETPFDRLHSFEPVFSPRPPVGTDMLRATEQLFEQMMSAVYPAHPVFGLDEVRTSHMNRVLDILRRAVEAPNGRLEVEREHRELMSSLAQPLGCGEMFESAFLVSDTWKNHFAREAPPENGAYIVKRLRDALDRPEARGLPQHVADGVLLFFMAQQRRSAYRLGGPVDVAIMRLLDDVEFREADLPSEDVWRRALKLSRELFGSGVGESRTPLNVARCAADARSFAENNRETLQRLLKRLEDLAAVLQVPPDVLRLKVTRESVDLLQRLQKVEGQAAIETLARAIVSLPAPQMAQWIRSAAEVVSELSEVSRDVLTAARQFEDARAETADVFLSRMKGALETFAGERGFGSVVRESYAGLVRLLAERSPMDPPPPPVERPVSRPESVPPSATARLVPPTARSVPIGPDVPAQPSDCGDVRLSREEVHRFITDLHTRLDACDHLILNWRIERGAKSS